MKSLAFAALLVVATLAAPALAAPNNGAFQRSGEGLKVKVDQALCASVKGWLDNAEKEADKRAGTAAAEKWSKLADGFWADGVSLGCSWAQ
jgi:hypothetical protein